MVPHLNDGTPYTPPIAVTFGALLNRSIAEEMPSRKSVRGLPHGSVTMSVAMLIEMKPAKSQFLLLQPCLTAKATQSRRRPAVKLLGRKS
jgi:hypothetical protein